MAKQTSKQGKQGKQEKEISANITLRIYPKWVDYDNDEGGFWSYKTPIGKLMVDVKFTEEAEEKYCDELDTPTDITFKTKNLNINTSKDYPVIWIRK